MATNKKQASLRFTDTGKAYLVATAEKMGISQSAAIEIAIRLLAQREGVELPKQEKKEG